MIPVEQRQLYVPDVSVGDCWKCCIASILELDYDDVPHFYELEARGEIESGWNATQDFLRERGLAMATFALWGAKSPRLQFGTRRIGYHFTAPGHWIAGVESPRKTPEGDHLSHVVVMRGSYLVWDPHPARDEGHNGFTEAFLLVTA